MAKNLLIEFKSVKIEQVGKDFNSHADALARLSLVFEGEIGRTIAVNLILTPNHEVPQESILVHTELELDPSHQSMALRPMGEGHRGGPTPSSWKQEVFVSNNELLYKVGGSRIAGPNKRDGRNQIHP